MQVSLNLNENEYNKLLKNDQQSVTEFSNKVKDKITAANNKNNKSVKVTIVLEDPNNE